VNNRSNLAYDNRIHSAYSSTAAHPAPHTLPQSSPNVRIKVSKKARSAAQRRANVLGIIRILFVMSCAFVILCRGVMLTDKCAAIEKKQAELGSLIATNEKLQFEIDRSLDLDHVEKIARNDLGMHPVEKYQTVYINLEQVDYVEHVAKNEFSPASRIADFFTGLVEYLD